jgi:hypothetical protein
MENTIVCDAPKSKWKYGRVSVMPETVAKKVGRPFISVPASVCRLATGTTKGFSMAVF